MNKTWIFGSVGIVVLLAVGAVGTVKSAKHRSVDTPSLPQHTAEFLRECRGAIREQSGNAVCKCMMQALDGALRTNDEYKLAGAIVVAIAESGPNRSRMQARFNKISQQFHERVSIDRKASVLKVVSTEGVRCGKAHGA